MFVNRYMVLFLYDIVSCIQRPIQLDDYFLDYIMYFLDHVYENNLDIVNKILFSDDDYVDGIEDNLYLVYSDSNELLKLLNMIDSEDVEKISRLVELFLLYDIGFTSSYSSIKH